MWNSAVTTVCGLLLASSVAAYGVAPEAQGNASGGPRIWTYTLRQGVKFEDGTPVTSKDVRYAVERSVDTTTFPSGPTWFDLFNDHLDLQGYTSPYRPPTS